MIRKNFLLAAIAVLCFSAPASAQFAVPNFSFDGNGAGGFAVNGGKQSGNTVNNGSGGTNATPGSSSSGKSSSFYDVGKNTGSQGGLAFGGQGSNESKSDSRDYVNANGSRNYGTNAQTTSSSAAGAAKLDQNGLNAGIGGGFGTSGTAISGQVQGYQVGNGENVASGTSKAQAGTNYSFGASTAPGASNGSGVGSAGSTESVWNGRTSVVGNGAGGYSQQSNTTAYGVGGAAIVRN